MTDERQPLPPFTQETAAQNVQGAKDAWNTCDPHKVALAHSDDSAWRNRAAFITGRDEIHSSGPGEPRVPIERVKGRRGPHGLFAPDHQCP